jgi:hypothetical protein
MVLSSHALLEVLFLLVSSLWCQMSVMVLEAV